MSLLKIKVPLSTVLFFFAVSCLPQKPLDSCQLTFNILQKDAYREKGGRNYPFFPVHTSTQLKMLCLGKDAIEVNHANHGAEPGEKDASGRDLLDLTYQDTMTLSEEKAEAFKKIFEKLSCEETSEFLSIDKATEEVGTALYSDQFRDSLAEEFKKELASLGKQSALERFTNLYASGDYNKALEEAYNEFSDPSLWGTTFSSSWVTSVQKELSLSSEKFHVCNNDARVSLDLWNEMKANPNSKLKFDEKWLKNRCSTGPLLFLDPKE